jgi:hypothetical protein
MPLLGSGEGPYESARMRSFPRGAPGPVDFGQPPSPPHSSITGWISFVMSVSESELVGLPRSDLSLSPVDENPNYVGMIRLWKDAEPNIPNGPAV